MLNQFIYFTRSCCSIYRNFVESFKRVAIGFSGIKSKIDILMMLIKIAENHRPNHNIYYLRNNHQLPIYRISQDFYTRLCCKYVYYPPHSPEHLVHEELARYKPTA